MSTPAHIPAPIETSGIKSDPDYVRQTQSAQVPQSQFNPYWQNMTPFTTSLPPESQQMLAGAHALDPNDPFSATMMNGAEQYVGHSYYPWGNDMHQGFKAMPAHPGAYHGMVTTLAPSALTTQAESISATPSSSHPATLDGHFSGASPDPLGLGHLMMPPKDQFSPHSLPSGQNTPGESFWSNFVQDGGWGEEAIPGA